jgi:hypothetical protein
MKNAKAKTCPKKPKYFKGNYNGDDDDDDIDDKSVQT